jgi:hypothetical protein
MIVLVQALLITVLGATLQSWIWVALVPLAFGLAAFASPARAAGRGAAAGGMSWLVLSLYFYFTGSRVIAGRVAAMFGLGAGRGWLMVVFTALLGMLVAGLAAYGGASLRAALKKNAHAE